MFDLSNARLLNVDAVPLPPEIDMHDTLFWIALFGTPLILLVMTTQAFRSSGRPQYPVAKRVITEDKRPTRRRRR